MPHDINWLPGSTQIDPAEDPPGSIDPLGTLAHAERLAESVLPKLTARMWRVRLLTIATITAAVAERTVALMEDREDMRLDPAATLSQRKLLYVALTRAKRAAMLIRMQ